MDRIETDEFSVTRGDLFEAVTAAAGSISFKRRPDELFSPQMSVWTSDPDAVMSPMERLGVMLGDAPSIVERRAVVFAAMTGEWSRVDDRLEDYATGESRPWRRLRVLLVAADGSTWYHATAMSDERDFPAVEAELVEVLRSIDVKATGERASEIRARAEQEAAELVARMMEQGHAASGQPEVGEVGATAKVAPPARDVEACFDRAVASAGVADRRDALRRIAWPTLVMTEAGESDPDRLGQSRVGGGPDLPEALEWPRDRSGFHLNFLAQINLADLPDRREDLPGDGLLSFFSGTDLSNGTVLYTASGSALAAHALPLDAEETAIRGRAMVRWDGVADRFVAEATADGDLAIVVDASGRMTFLRHGEPIVVLASEYEVGCSRQSLRFERSLTVPFGMPGLVPAVYVGTGLDDPADFCLAMDEAFALGNGPQHQMFGVTGTRDLPDMQDAAAAHARRSGWHDLTAPRDWFLLLKIASGGEVGFSFSDHGDLIFMANQRETRRGGFSRIYAFVESG